ncbi:MAG: hypothetical protein IBX69_01220 [Anaerolineales bacterium]|nr:hypothetical protein [Anaerolineales bacterium]
MAKLRYRFHWTIAACGALIAWLLILFVGSDLPQTLALLTWQPEALFPVSPELLIDRFSWSYALALATLLFSVILTDTVKNSGADWKSWSGNSAFIALGIFAVTAGNPITLLLAWMAIDIIELMILFSNLPQSNMREKVVVTFTARTFSSFLVIVAGILSAAQGQDLTFLSISNEASVALLLAAGLRLGVVPIHIPLTQSLPLGRGLGTISRLVPTAAGLILLVRTASVQQPNDLTTVFLGLAAIALIYGGVSWLSAKDQLDGQPAWILSMAALSLASAVRGEPLASMSWGLSGLLGGGLLFLFSARNRWMIWIPLVGLIAMSALPYTPNWNGAKLYSQPFNIMFIPILLGQALLLAGYARHALHSQNDIDTPERWIKLIYPLGLFLLLGILFSLGLLFSPSAQTIPLLGWFAGVIASGLAVLLFFWASHWKAIPPDWVARVNSFISFHWLYKGIWALYRFIGRILGIFTRLLEGEGGIIWAILIMGLLYSYLARMN